MPIRFRCAYCNQLMAIATRKAGTVVRCPTCAGQVVVPQPVPGAEPEKPTQDPAPAPAPAGALFDRPDFEQKLQGSVPMTTSTPAPAGFGGQSRSAIDVEPVRLSSSGMMDAGMPASPPAGFYMTPGRLTILSVVMLVLLGLAFFAGMMVGKG